MNEPGHATADDCRFMAEALRLARLGENSTHPNPRVGCVLVRNGQVVGRGWHRRAGEPHAEVHALADAGCAAHGATAYVTLEPCCHHGRTPPCSQALIEAGIAHLVTALCDPDPRVAGGGLAQMRAAGISVLTGVLASDAEALNRGFLSRMRRARPWLTLKLAKSLDGRTAMASGESRWITGAEARADVQRLRARSSAVMTGIGTLLADDPSLNVRPVDASPEEVRQPLRVVVDSGLRTPAQARTLALPGTVLLATTTAAAANGAALQAAGAELLVLPAGPDGRVPLSLLLQRLAEREVNEVLVEAGATLAGALLTAGLVDELVLYMAPDLLGDAARGLVSLPGLDSLAQRVRLRFTDVRAVGGDLRLTLAPVPR